MATDSRFAADFLATAAGFVVDYPIPALLRPEQVPSYHPGHALMQQFRCMTMATYVAVCLTFTLASCVAAQVVDDSTADSSVAGLSSEDTEGIEFFERHIRPLLAEHCYECHAGVNASGGLQLDNREAILRGGDSGPALVEQHPESSLLLTAVSYRDPSLKMPPEDDGSRLSELQIDLLEQWIQMGAPSPTAPAPTAAADPLGRSERLGGMSRDEATQWWAFQPWKGSIDVPQLGAANAIDCFVNEKLVEQGIEPLPAADPRTLVRRLFYDLIGLPPDPEVVEAFAADPSPEAYSRLVNQLLDSPQYGVQWGRHWLDLVRYADTAGENTDRPLPHIWRYRNWVIEAFNQDMPYDEFVRLQLAGDLVRRNERGERYSEGIVATGYLALARRFGHDIDQDVHLMHEDVIDNLGKTFLGLTVACARCHDHKYDPISAGDYYALYGIFANSRFSFSGCEAKGAPRDLVPLLSPEDNAIAREQWQERRRPFDRQIKTLDESQEHVWDVWQQEVRPQIRTVLIGSVPDGGSASLDVTTSLQVQAGELLLLVVGPQGNHGADTTRVQWTIEEVDGQGNSWSTDRLVGTILSGDAVNGGIVRRAIINGSPVTENNEQLANVWAFVDWKRELPEPLAEAIEGIAGNESLKGWQGGDTPSAFVNASTEPVSVWTTLPPKSFFVHPGPDGPVAVAWISPISGQVRCRGSVQDAHPGGPNGIDFSIQHVAIEAAAEKILQVVDLNDAKRKIAIQRDAASGQEPQPPVAFAVVDSESELQNARIHLRGDPEKLGDEVARGWIEILGGAQLSNNAESGRRELAEWIVRHPLSTRVYVNRIWQHHFGRGIVNTPNDFGTRGEPPTHPALLEWLSAQFVASGHSTKALHRIIVHSDAYRRASVGADDIAEVDPENRWLARFERRRMTAEELRDSLLFVAGTLDLSAGESHPFPPESTWTFTQHTPFNAVYDNRLRTAYQMVQRQRRHPFLALFDGSDPNASTATRQRTTTPTQALYFMNDSFFHEQTATLAEKLLGDEAMRDAEARIHQLYRIMFQRRPNELDVAECTGFLESYPGSPIERWQALCRVMAASNEFLTVD